ASQDLPDEGGFSEGCLGRRVSGRSCLARQQEAEKKEDEMARGRHGRADRRWEEVTV
ncbi:MAG: hypothetical protein HN712_20520, partial [Gemmatimonadetes bacterium]|nr:hypothetical protein [Gemmatimonadota bacterium]